MIDFLKLPSPCYVLDEELLDRNLATVDRVRRESGAEIIVALKACAMWSIFPELAKHSDGATASSAAEARLGGGTCSRTVGMLRQLGKNAPHGAGLQGDDNFGARFPAHTVDSRQVPVQQLLVEDVAR